MRRKKLLSRLFMSATFVFLGLSWSISVLAQEGVLTPSNRTVVNLEKNLLFNATGHYKVTQTGSAQIALTGLFDGHYYPCYSATAPSDTDPTVITIENLPEEHIQAGAWIGWSTRFWNPSKFKIEIYNTWPERPMGWVSVADMDNFFGGSFMTALPASVVSKIRITIYRGVGDDGRFGISELFFLHPETACAYDNLMVKQQIDGSVGIGTDNTRGFKLAVNGSIRAREIKVENATWPDYVFSKSYQKTPLDKLELFINKNKHLPEIPSAQEVSNGGVNLGDMNARMLKKIEEFSLYLIEQNKEIQELKKSNQRLQNQLNHLKSKEKQ